MIVRNFWTSIVKVRHDLLAKKMFLFSLKKLPLDRIYLLTDNRIAVTIHVYLASTKQDEKTPKCTIDFDLWIYNFAYLPLSTCDDDRSGSISKRSSECVKLLVPAKRNVPVLDGKRRRGQIYWTDLTEHTYRPTETSKYFSCLNVVERPLRITGFLTPRLSFCVKHEHYEPVSAPFFFG